MEERRKGKQTNWPYLKMPQSLLRRLHKIAEQQDLIPSEVEKGQNAVKLGALKALEWLVKQEEKRAKRRTIKDESEE